MNRSRSCQINDTSAKKGVAGKCRQESIGGPKCVGDDGIDESSQRDGIQEISLHLSAFSDRACHNTRHGTGESKLEEPKLQIDVVVTLEEKSLVTDKRLGGVAVITAVGKGVSSRPKGNATAARVEKIPQNHIFDVLGADGPRAEHLCSEAI